VILFFGNIAPYKGLEYLIAAFQTVAQRDNYRLIIAGRPKDCENYWKTICERLSEGLSNGRILLRSDYVPDIETEIYFKAADILVLPYTYIFQSGVLLLAYSFGLPVIATDVGSLRDDVVEGKTGFLCEPRNSVDLARAIETYFSSGLFNNLGVTRREIQDWANVQYSWKSVVQTTLKAYESLLAR
jgi:glycosyltransferase involved in cell wall biosynthesis